MKESAGSKYPLGLCSIRQVMKALMKAIQLSISDGRRHLKACLGISLSTFLMELSTKEFVNYFAFSFNRGWAFKWKCAAVPQSFFNSTFPGNPIKGDWWNGLSVHTNYKVTNLSYINNLSLSAMYRPNYIVSEQTVLSLEESDVENWWIEVDKLEDKHFEGKLILKFRLRSMHF